MNCQNSSNMTLYLPLLALCVLFKKVGLEVGIVVACRVLLGIPASHPHQNTYVQVLA